MSETGTALAEVKSAAVQQFELDQRKSSLLSHSPLIPQHLRGNNQEQAMANCYIAVQLADVLKEPVPVVMQNMHVINGKAGFATQYMIARANASGAFKQPINWEINGSGDGLSVTAFAERASDGERVEFTVTMEMAKAEGWTSNKKYRTIPEVMLRYRAAAFLIRFNAPEVMLGYHTTEELVTIGPEKDLEGQEGPRLTREAIMDHAEKSEAVVVNEKVEDAEIEEIEATPEPKPTPEPSQAEAAERAAQDIDGPLDSEGREEPAEPGEPDDEPTSAQAEQDSAADLEPENNKQDLSTAKFLEMRKAIQSAKSLVAVNLAVDEWHKHSHVYSDEQRAQVTADIDKAQERIRNAAEKKK